MPTKRHFRGRHRADQFGGGKRLQLECGQDFFSDGYGRDNPDREAMRRDWNLHGAGILRDWVAAHPCSRPWAFWEFETLPGSPKMAGLDFVRLGENFVSQRDYLADAKLLSVDELALAKEEDCMDGDK